MRRVRSPSAYLLVTTWEQLVGEQDSRSYGDISRGCPVVRISGTDVRRVEASTLGTDLIIQHGVTDVLGQAGELCHILGGIQEPFDFASLRQWGKVLKDIIQTPGKLCTSDWVSTSEKVSYFLRIVLLSCSLTSTSGTGALNDPASRSTRGINVSIVWRHAVIC